MWEKGHEVRPRASLLSAQCCSTSNETKKTYSCVMACTDWPTPTQKRRKKKEIVWAGERENTLCKLQTMAIDFCLSSQTFRAEEEKKKYRDKKGRGGESTQSPNKRESLNGWFFHLTQSLYIVCKHPQAVVRTVHIDLMTQDEGR